MNITRDTGSIKHTVEYRGKELQVIAILSRDEWSFEMRSGGKSLTPSLQSIQVSGLYPTDQELETAILNLFLFNKELEQHFEE